jgi:5'-nucleotidase
MRRALAVLLLSVCACGGSRPTGPAEAGPPPRPTAAPDGGAPSAKIISIIGLNDFHGHVERLAAFGGYVDRLRERRARDGGVVLVDAGDMFQGTLESSLGEGAAVIAGYNALGFTAAALGNHDFDYGPVGEARPGPGVDPQGALRARLAEANFPVLSANLVDLKTGRRPAWTHLFGSVLVEVAGVKVGLVGAITRETPSIVMRAYFAGLDVQPLAESLASEARSLRTRGARVVVAVVHAGGKCTNVDDPHATDGCDANEEIARVAAELPRGSVDAIVAGHTHHAVAHFLSGIPVVEAWAWGEYFSRLDLTVPPEPGAALAVEIHPPERVCAPSSAEGECVPHEYEGGRVLPNPAVERAVAEARRQARDKKAEPLGVEVVRRIEQAYDVESALGNLFADLLLESAKGADLALLNGGGLRAPLPEGALTYGRLYESQPFDNKVALVSLTGAELRAVLREHLRRPRQGIVSIGGGRIEARCKGAELIVRIVRTNGKPVGDAERLRVVTSDYLATGGDDLFAPVQLPDPAVAFDSGTVRDALAAELRKRGGRLDGQSVTLLDRDHPRLTLPSARPVICGKSDR